MVPLLEYYTIDEVNATEVTIRVLGKTEAMNIAHTFEAGYGTKFPILGLYSDYLNTVEIYIGDYKTVEPIIRKIQTKALSGVSDATVHIDNLGASDEFNQDLYWSLGGGAAPPMLAYDRKGHIRYYFEFPSDFAGQMARVSEYNGQIVIENVYGTLSLEGEVLFKANTGYTYHHDSIQLNNGNYVILANSTWGSEDRVIEQTSSGMQVKDKTFGSLFRDIVDVDSNENRTEDMKILNQIIYDEDNKHSSGAIDWAHANSLVYDEDNDIMYFSLRQQAVIAVDYSDWKLLWWMVDDTLYTSHAGVPNPDCTFMKIQALAPYRVGGDAISDGPKNQHALFLHSDGDLGMFDNGGDDKLRASRYVRYKITGSTGSWSATKIKEYKDESLFSQYVSDVDFTGDSNLLIDWGGIKRIREINLASDSILFDIEMFNNFGVYRTEKMPLYPYQDSTKKYSIDYNEKEGK